MEAVDSAVQFAIRQKSIASRNEVDIQKSSAGIDYVKLSMIDGRVLEVSIKALEDESLAAAGFNFAGTKNSSKAFWHVLLAAPIILFALFVLYAGVALVYSIACTNAFEYPGSSGQELKNFCLGPDPAPVAPPKP